MFKLIGSSKKSKLKQIKLKKKIFLKWFYPVVVRGTYKGSGGLLRLGICSNILSEKHRLHNCMY